MPLEDFSKHQQGIIKRYYDNFDQIQIQRLSELAGELYLSTGKKLEKNWESVRKTLENMKVPDSRIEHIMTQRDPKLVAGIVKEMMG